jgi:hypothetical protein
MSEGKVMRDAPPMMGCGHAANGWKGDAPVCVICAGRTSGAYVIAQGPDLSARSSKCVCGSTVPSSTKLPFFEYRSDMQFDGHYCGHAGWD